MFKPDNPVGTTVHTFIQKRELHKLVQKCFSTGNEKVFKPSKIFARIKIQLIITFDGRYPGFEKKLDILEYSESGISFPKIRGDKFDVRSQDELHFF